MRGDARLLALLSVLAAGPIAAEINLGLTQSVSLLASGLRSDTISAQEDAVAYAGSADTHLVVTPGMELGGDLIPDLRIDAYVSKPFDGSPIRLSPLELFVDFLYRGGLSLKLGYLKSELGYNSVYDPLDILDFDPAFREKFPTIRVGRQSVGNEGLPGAVLGLGLPELAGILQSHADIGAVFLSSSDYRDWYYYFKWAAHLHDAEFGAVAGGTARDFGDAGRFPVFGANLAYVFPFGLSLFYEGVYKKFSYRPTIQDGALATKRPGEGFLDQDFRAELGLTDPLFGNNLSISLEYFSYGEGLDASEYESVIAFLSAPGNASLGNSLLVADRNFPDYLEATLGYSLSMARLSAAYSLAWESVSGTMRHQFSINKAWGGASVSLFLGLAINDEEKYRVAFGDEVWQGGFEASLDL
ncbi:MAG TPA: hypothetical protein VMV83_02620 [Rectinemataceae bacterium]|nr:hypothetical protein [Rectinemataceae bacterium]